MDQMGLGEDVARRGAPLADRMRPRTLAEVVGQPQLTGERALLRRAVAEGRPYSFVLYGPPGTGKTTIAMAAARELGLAFEQLNAVTDGVKDLREVIERAKGRRGLGEGTLLFLDEISRWSKAQQDALLPHVENGTVVLIGATTENPGFELNRALRSRLKVEHVRRLTDADVAELVDRALADDRRGLGARRLTLAPDAREQLLRHADGDARAALSGLEHAATLADDGDEIGEEVLLEALGARAFPGRTEHFDLASALIKTIRGSDPDAALYWLARMEASGEEPRFVARRLLIGAAEEVGLAAPGALAVANAGFEATMNLGPPECWIVLAEVACYLATCPKSWASYLGLAEARRLVAEHPAHPVPLALRNATDDVSRDEGARAAAGQPHVQRPPPRHGGREGLGAPSGVTRRRRGASAARVVLPQAPTPCSSAIPTPCPPASASACACPCPATRRASAPCSRRSACARRTSTCAGRCASIRAGTQRSAPPASSRGASACSASPPRVYG
jgi:putative ATPase